jgi:glycosyltransferase involved in cell wall biosynthesis
MRKNRADAVKNMLECDAFARLGYDVTLVTPHVHRPEYPVSREEMWKLYGLEPTFRVLELPTFYRDKVANGPDLAVRLQKVVAFGLFAVALALRTHVDRRHRTLILQDIAGSTAVAFVRRLLRPRWTLVHLAATFVGPLANHRRLIEQCDGVIAINDHIRDGVIDAYGVPPERVARPDPYSYLEIFERSGNGHVATRAELGLPEGVPVVSYTGKITFPPHAEIELLLDAAQRLPGVHLALIGGNGESEDVWRRAAADRGLTNVTFLGFRPLIDLYRLGQVSDVMVSYYSATDALAANNRVPAKYSLYRCAGKPMVVPDMPGIREVVSEDEAVMVEPDRPELLAAAIRRLLEDPDEATAKGSAALRRAQESSISRFCRELSGFFERLA